MTIDVAWITCDPMPEPDVDETSGLKALRDAGLSVECIPWDGPHDPADYRLCVIRSTWNYFEQPAKFLSWVDRAATRSHLLNAPDIVKWNIHKGYLLGLEAADVPIVPTRWFAQKARRNLADVCFERSWTDVVIKPAVSAGSHATRRFRDGASREAQEFFDAQLAVGDMLVQPYVPSVETAGERCLVWIDGSLSHTVVKQPRFADDEESVRLGPPPTDADHALVGHCLDAASHVGRFDRSGCLYARIDVVEWEGRTVLSELELLEPSLFTSLEPAGAASLAQALVRRLGAL